MALFTNRAILTYNGAETVSNTVTGELIGALTVYKEAVPSVYSPGDTVAYAVSLVNSGSEPLTGLTLTDDLGAYAEAGESRTPLTFVPGSAVMFIEGLLAGAPVPTGTDPLTFGGITVPANGDVLLIYDAAVNSFAPIAAGSQIENTATVTGAGEEARASAVISVSEEPELSVTKSVSPPTVMPNGRLTYTFVIENSGNADAGGDLVLSDAFSPVLSDIAVTLNAAPLDAGAGYDYDPLTGEFATLPGAITVPAAGFTRSADGTYAVTPGRATLTVTGAV